MIDRSCAPMDGVIVLVMLSLLLGYLAAEIVGRMRAATVIDARVTAFCELAAMPIAEVQRADVAALEALVDRVDPAHLALLPAARLRAVGDRLAYDAPLALAGGEV